MLKINNLNAKIEDKSILNGPRTRGPDTKHLITSLRQNAGGAHSKILNPINFLNLTKDVNDKQHNI